MIPETVKPGGGNGSGESSDEVVGGKNDGGGPIPPGLLKAEEELSIASLKEAVLGEWRSSEIATKMLASLSVVCIDRHARVETEAMSIDAQGVGVGVGVGVGTNARTIDEPRGSSPVS